MKKLLIILLTTFLLYIPNKVEASEACVIDDASILTSEQVETIEDCLKEVSDKHNINVVFYTTTEYPSEGISRQAAEKLDSLSYYDGFIFELNLSSMEYEIVVMGSAEYLRGYLEYGLDILYDALVNQDYVLANKQFASFIDYAYEDYAYQENNHKHEEVVKKEPMSIMDKALISAGAGVAVSIVVLLILNSQLKSEGKKQNANNYIKPHSFNLTRSGDIFLYRNVHRTLRPRDNDNGSNLRSGGGHFTSGHTSSGHSYSGGGGRKL